MDPANGVDPLFTGTAIDASGFDVEKEGTGASHHLNNGGESSTSPQTFPLKPFLSKRNGTWEDNMTVVHCKTPARAKEYDQITWRKPDAYADRRRENWPFYQNWTAHPKAQSEASNGAGRIQIIKNDPNR